MLTTCALPSLVLSLAGGGHDGGSLSMFNARRLIQEARSASGRRLYGIIEGVTTRAESQRNQGRQGREREVTEKREKLCQTAILLDRQTALLFVRW